MWETSYKKFPTNSKCFLYKRSCGLDTEEGEEEGDEVDEDARGDEEGHDEGDDTDGEGEGGLVLILMSHDRYLVMKSSVEFVGGDGFDVRAAVGDLEAEIIGNCPADGVGNDPLHVGVVVGAAGFVTGLEVDI